MISMEEYLSDKIVLFRQLFKTLFNKFTVQKLLNFQKLFIIFYMEEQDYFETNMSQNVEPLFI